MLRQDYRLSIAEFEKELPSDENGLDVARIWQIVRNYTRDLNGWELTPDVVLSTFSFTKFLMWKDLVDRVEMLKRNPVVKHLIDIENTLMATSPLFLVQKALTRSTLSICSLRFRQICLSLQQLWRRMPVRICSVRSPGTGKSQTIANMISQCLAGGKTVLFVSQKTAAFEVVQRRLRDIGLGEYCLEVHSTKAQKSIVLGQLKTAWHDRSASDAAGWQAATSELAKLRDELNRLVVALHRRRENGMTAHEAFGRAVSAHGSFGDLKFDWGDGEHTPDQLAEMRDMVRAVRTDLPRYRRSFRSSIARYGRNTMERVLALRTELSR